jgi:hypothetical protein
MLRLTSLGLGSLALECLLSREQALAQPSGSGLAPQAPHTAPRAKSVILLMQNGGPSQMELFDPKPDLDRHHGKQHSLKVEMFQRRFRTLAQWLTAYAWCARCIPSTTITPRRW